MLVSDVISKTGRFLSKRAFPREEKLKTLMGKQKRISELCSTQKRGKICESIFWQHQFMTFEWDFLLACCSIPVACSVSRHYHIHTKLSVDSMCLLCWSIILSHFGIQCKILIHEDQKYEILVRSIRESKRSKSV